MTQSRPDKCRLELKKMGKSIVEMENEFDYSMRGVWLDELVTNYVAERGKTFCKMFDYLMENQKKIRTSYGDHDVVVTKIKVTGVEPTKYETHEATALVVNDIFCGNIFVIVKVVSKLKDDILTDRAQIKYYVRRIAKNRKSFALNDAEAHVDTKGNDRVVFFELGYYREELEVKDGRGMSYYYTRFKDAYDALRCPYYELTGDK